MSLNRYDVEKHHIALGTSAVAGSINYLEVAPEIPLEYWYRLGEDGPWPTTAIVTPDFAVDSSGNLRHLDAYNRNTDGSGVQISSPSDPALPTCNIADPLATPGEDGGMQFNLNEYQWITWGRRVMLGADHSFGLEVPFRGIAPPPDGTGSTFAAWLAFTPPVSGVDSFAPRASDGSAEVGFIKPLISSWQTDYGVELRGSHVGFSPADGKLLYETGLYISGGPTVYRWTSPSGFAPGEWFHFVVTIQKLSSTVFRRRIYINGAMVFDLSDTATAVGVSRAGNPLSIGGGEDGFRLTHGRGKVDEVAYWSGVLSDSQIVALVNPPTGAGPQYGFTLENAYAKFVQRTALPGATDVGGSLDLIAPKPEESIWTQDEFTGGTFQYRYDTDASMFADCTGYVPAQQSKSLVTVPPVFFKRDFNPAAYPNPAGRTNLVNPNSMFTVAGSIFCCFEHGIMRYITGTNSFVWGNYMVPNDVDGNRHWYAGADYDRNEQCIYVLANCLDTVATDKPILIRLDPETLLPWGTENQVFTGAPAKTENMKGYGLNVNDQHIVLGIGLRLYTVDPPEKPQDPDDKPVWTHIGRLPGRWVDSVAFNGMTYILSNTEDGKSQIVAFDGTYILPVAMMAFNFRGTCMTVYGGRIYIGGSGTDINGTNRYAELHELTGSSTRLVRTFAPESRQSRVTYPTEIWDLTVAEGLLWWAEKNVRLWTYDLTGDAFFGASTIQHPNVNFFRQVVGRERLWLWGAHDSIAGQHGLYRIPISGDTVAGYESFLVTSDFMNDFARNKEWHEIVILTRYYPANAVDYSTDGGATWTNIPGAVSTSTGDLHFLTVDLSDVPVSKVIRFRIHQGMGTLVDVFGELIAFTVSFTVQEPEEPLKHGWNLIINAAENVEARDGSNQYQDVDTMKETFWYWAETKAKLMFKDLGGKDYLVKFQDFVEQQPIVGPNVTDGVNPEAYFAITLLETTMDED